METPIDMFTQLPICVHTYSVNANGMPDHHPSPLPPPPQTLTRKFSKSKDVKMSFGVVVGVQHIFLKTILNICLSYLF